MESYLKQLEGLGLTEKEAKVYLASLELGSATAQQIAGKAAVVRPTAYVAIGGLVKRGLMSQFTKGKKQYYSAEKPDQLMRLVQDEKKKIVEQEEKLKAILPGLSSLISLAGEKPEVKFYEGLEGLEAMRAVLHSDKSGELLVFGSPEKYMQTVPGEMIAVHDYRAKQKKIIKQIGITTKSKNPIGMVKHVDWKFVKKSKLENAEFAIFGDNVSVIVYLDKPYGFLIKSTEIANTARTLFEITWKGLR